MLPKPWNILSIGSANESWRYNVTSSLIGWSHAQIDIYPNCVITVAIIVSNRAWSSADTVLAEKLDIILFCGHL